MEQALRAAGCRITRQRSAILEYLAVMDAHPSARQVYGEVKRTTPGVSLATVYNTLGKLVRMRLIRLIDSSASDNRYDGDPEPHVNLICTVCGRIQDFERGLPVALEAVRAQAGFEVRDVRLEYYGKCAECRTRAEPGAGNLPARRNLQAKRRKA
jgi:Fur family transcriptional regulator, peroxide stress response regulator